MPNVYYTYKIDPNLFFERLNGFLQQKERKTRDEEKILSLIEGGACFIEDKIPDRPEEPYRPIKPTNPRRTNFLGISSPVDTLLFDNYQNELNSYQRELNLYRNEHNLYQKKLDFYNQYQEHSVRSYVKITFSILNNFKIHKKTEGKLIDICNLLMPPETGFKVNKIEFKPLLPEINRSYYNKINWSGLIDHINSNELQILPENKYLNVKSLPDGFYEDLVFLINKCYLLGIYEAVQIFSRKLLENLLVDILRKKFSTRNIDLFFNTNSGRFHGFSTLLDNFKNNLDEFKPYSGALDHSFLEKIKKYKVFGDSSAHTLELNVKKEDLDNSDLEYIINHLISIYNKI